MAKTYRILTAKKEIQRYCSSTEHLFTKNIGTNNYLIFPKNTGF